MVILGHPAWPDVIVGTISFLLAMNLLPFVAWLLVAMDRYDTRYPTFKHSLSGWAWLGWFGVSTMSMSLLLPGWYALLGFVGGTLATIVGFGFTYLNRLVRS